MEENKLTASLLAGSIKFFRLPDVLQLIAMQWLTGMLTLKNEDKKVDIYIRKGRVAFAAGGERSANEQLGAVLLRMGRLDAAKLEAALAKSRQTGERLGKVLIHSGLVSEADTRTALLKQTERSVYKAMAWGDGTFSFDCCEMPDFVEDIPIELAVENLILEGVRRIGEERTIAEKIPSLGAIFTRPMFAPGQLEGMDLKGNERPILELVDGRRDVKEIIKASGLDGLSVMRALFALYSAGLIRKYETSSNNSRTDYI